MAARRGPRVTPETVKQVIALRQAGLDWQAIADHSAVEGLDTADRAEAVWDAAMGKLPPSFDLTLEVSRLDRLQRAVWPAAAAGELRAVERALALVAMRERLTAKPQTNDHALQKAFDASVESSTALLDGVDSALVAAGRSIADRVDEAVATGQGQEITKALYLLPHMMNALDRMLATPQSRVKAEAEAEVVKRKLERAAGSSKDEKAANAFKGLRAVE